ncbi:hypothetical protein HanRHA438_Chr17g0835291 [Helianthus annuus]|nr:hypothetical protein HanRHA438_Chr17g0835291 [Helianthus annuus]
MGRAHSCNCNACATAARTGCMLLDPCMQVLGGHTQMVAKMVQLVRSSPPELDWKVLLLVMADSDYH